MEKNQMAVKQRLTASEAGNITLTLIAQKAENRGLNCDREEFDAKLENISKRLGIELPKLLSFYANFYIPAALKGLNLEQYINIGRTQEGCDDVWNIALALLREEGVHISPRDFNARLEGLAKKTGVHKRDLQLFYLQEILPYVIGSAFGWVSCTITFPDNGSGPDDITGSFGR